MTKFIFITGGIVSGIGKGITSASVGFLLQKRGYKVEPVKVDPYLNKDAGTMNPFQHGEVFVTDDGAETDLDLGHYERFLDKNLTKMANFTTGAVYSSVITQERKGDFLGKTIQIIPHVTNEIKRRILKLKSKNPDFITVEIGGTVGDIEGLPFIEAIRQFRQDINGNNCLYIHIVKMDYIYPSDEAKTKPIQQSIAMLRGFGIQPDLLIVRCKRPMSKELREKISLFGGIKDEQIIPAVDTQSLYQIPVNLEREGLARQICKILNIKNSKINFSDWQKIIDRANNPKNEISVGFVGKYLDNPDAYLSVVEALKHAGIQNDYRVNIIPIDSESKNLISKLKNVQAILIPGGFGIRGIEGKIQAIKYARENNIPFLGLCLGLQCAVIEFARNICGLEKANSTEFNPETPNPVIEYLPDQINIKNKGGTMRLGQYPANILENSLAKSLYQKNKIFERHRHRYEVNPRFHEKLQKNGLIFSGMSPNKKLVEIIELKNHPYFIACQFHPEFKSRPQRAHPLFSGLIKAGLKNKKI